MGSSAPERPCGGTAGGANAGGAPGDRVTAAVAELYACDPQEFTDRRKALAAAARTAGDSAASRQIAALRKPTRTAWVVNRLARADPAAPARLAGLSAALRAAEDARDGPRLRELSAARGRLIDDMTSEALAAVGVTDPPAGLRDEVTATLTAALADPDVAAGFAAGTLTRAAQWAGFGLALPGPVPGPDADGDSDSEQVGIPVPSEPSPEPLGSHEPQAAPRGTPLPRARPGSGSRPVVPPAPTGARPTPLEEGRRLLEEARRKKQRLARKARATEAAAKGAATGAAAKGAATEAAAREAAATEAAAREAAATEAAAREAAEATARHREIFTDAERAVASAAAMATDAVSLEDRLEGEVRYLEERLTRVRAELADARLRARRAEAAERRARQALNRLPHPEESR